MILRIDIFSTSYCNMNEHQFCFLFHMIQDMSSASSLNIPDIAISTRANLDVGQSCSLGLKGTRTKLEGSLSQYSFIMYVW